jgi:hypothetical protein
MANNQTQSDAVDIQDSLNHQLTMHAAIIVYVSVFISYHLDQRCDLKIGNSANTHGRNWAAMMLFSQTRVALLLSRRNCSFEVELKVSMRGDAVESTT